MGKYIIAKYMRYSTDKQDIAVQEESLDRFAKRYKEDHQEKEIEFVIFKDEGISGAKQDRPALNEMMNRIKKGQINCVMILKLDRLARSLQDLLNLTTQFKERNVDFIVADQLIDTSSPQGELLFHILGAFAQFERAIIMERTKAGRIKAQIDGSKSGKPCHRPKVGLDEDGVVLKFQNKISMNQIAKIYNVSITPIRRILKLRGLI